MSVGRLQVEPVIPLIPSARGPGMLRLLELVTVIGPLPVADARFDTSIRR